MTVTYTAEVATCRGFGCFLKLLFRWRGSIYKLVWPDLIAFLFGYFSLSLTYRFLLDAPQRKLFADIVHYCDTYSDLIPLSFVLGFYVSIVMTRWWSQYQNIPWPDPIAVFVSATIHGQDERGRLMRRTIMRYVCCCLALVFTMISPRVKKRFPTLDHFVEAGLLMENEKLIIEDLNQKFPRHSKHWLPIVWAASIVTRARKEGRIRDDFAVKTILDELNKFRGQCGLLLSYDTISVPLVYTQVVTLAVYSFFITAIVGRQWVDEREHPNHAGKHKDAVDSFFPIFTMLQFFFYMGWLKVAESLINPFGEDDDDFEVNWIVDRNLQVSYLIVDEMHHEHPELLRDQYWDEVFPAELPYTVAAEQYRDNIPEASTANIEIKDSDALISSSVPRTDENFMNRLASGESIRTPKRALSRQASARERQLSGRSSASSSTLNESNHGSQPAMSMPRVASITNVLRRMFSRDRESNLGSSVGTESGSRVDMFHSNQSLHTRGGTAGTTAITDQVIPELDEMQATVISMRKPESRPHMQDIFAIAVPTTPSPTHETSKPIFIMGSSATHSPQSTLREVSIESGSDDEKTHLRPRDLMEVSESAPSDIHTMLLEPTSSNIKIVKSNDSKEVV
ncbi:bestrophin-4-like [Neocloeon triangulifer]|uniref:bestrophin-4-like n=1 Tax=Neocloeon triangulifer TaxID=2078957 RepID=UPI00286F97DC|nr:bestrophin-4-like [Neocloeon triangulifer]